MGGFFAEIASKAVSTRLIKRFTCTVFARRTWQTVCNFCCIWSRVVSSRETGNWVSVPVWFGRIRNAHTFVEFSLRAELANRAGFDVVTHADLVAVKAFPAILTMHMLSHSERVVENVLVSQVNRCRCS